MESFLAEIAQTLRAEHPDDLERVTVIFNNRRSGLFLRRQFASMESQPFFLPRIIGIDDLIEELGGLKIVKKEYLLFELFEIHRAINPDNDKYSEFEDFISFGDMMLTDFAEIDLYCVDAKQLFSNLHDIKAIEKWNVDTQRPTPFQERYLAFYQSLYQYYYQLHERLLSQGKAYSGMAYRHVAENIETLVSANDKQQYYFIGFNAISTSEERIFRHYLRQGLGHFITDGDAYYYEDISQEAGHFLRNNTFRTGNFPDHFAMEHKYINIVSCPENVLQCKYAGELLGKQISNNPNIPIEQTAIVLADESLLLPTLNSMPDEIKTANITMGYPFCNTATHSLALKLFSLHQRCRQNLFYHIDILDFLSDEIISASLGISNIRSEISYLLTKDHIIYATCEEIDELCHSIGYDISPILFVFNKTPVSPDDFISMLRQLIQTIHDSLPDNRDRKENEALACLLQIVNHLQELQKKYHFINNLSVLLKIYTRLAQRISVSFYGEPLQGLQILGVLETRNLDFKNIILLSANEGTIPSGKTNNTLIPYDLKVSFGIPTFHEKDAVYAYNFYRLIQRANNIHLIYHTESENAGKGEPSRFLLQVCRELAKRYPDNITLSEEVLAANNIMVHNSETPYYQKTDLVLNRLEEISQYGFSPSALNKYRSCPLKFYYENILRVNELKHTTDDLEQNELGSCIHAVLERIYEPVIGSELKIEILEQALGNIDSLINQVLDIQFNHGRSHEGRNHFFESVARTQITNFLKKEIEGLKKNDKIQIISLEEELTHELNVMVKDSSKKVVIKGTADRIDNWNGFTRIIDYKSGKVDDKDLKVNDANPDWKNVSDKWFQVMLYTWLWQHTKQSTEPHLSGIYPLGNFKANLIVAQWETSTVLTPSHLQTFESVLQQLIADILDPDIPFIANPKSKSCSYCPFAENCLKDSN